MPDRDPAIQGLALETNTIEEDAAARTRTMDKGVAWYREQAWPLTHTLSSAASRRYAIPRPIRRSLLSTPSIPWPFYPLSRYPVTPWPYDEREHPLPIPPRGISRRRIVR